jgi:hypothetical protein
VDKNIVVDISLLGRINSDLHRETLEIHEERPNKVSGIETAPNGNFENEYFGTFQRLFVQLRSTF